MSARPTSIALRGWACVKGFDQLILIFKDSNGEKNSGMNPSAVTDEFSRFKLWAGNIGALHKAERTTSLEYRLRNAPRVQDYIRRLLDDLATALKDCK
jgi:hypothetical protein